MRSWLLLPCDDHHYNFAYFVADLVLCDAAIV